MYEASKSAVMSQKMMALGDMPVSRAELQVKASAEWIDYITKAEDARTAANRAKVQWDLLRNRLMEWQSAQANERLQAKL